MTIEAAITRKLSITFLAARELANEAKINLAVTGYPSPEMKLALIEESCKIFQNKPKNKQNEMKKQRNTLENTKMCLSSHHSGHSLHSFSFRNGDDDFNMSMSSFG